MLANSLEWQVPLGAKPRISQMGIGVHGSVPVERYLMPRLWCLHFYRYEAEMMINGRLFPILPGFVSLVPPGTRLEYRYKGRSQHCYAHFYLPVGGSDTMTIPAMLDLGREFETVNRLLEQAVEFFPNQRLRAEIRLWDILWQLSARSSHQSSEAVQMHPSVQKALQLVELHLQEPIYVTELAKKVGLSQNHLIRLFRASVGTTVVGYIRDRRLQRATHLLKNSTLSIKGIAHEVGIKDLHLFNKVIRRAHGVSPRKVRMRRS